MIRREENRNPFLAGAPGVSRLSIVSERKGNRQQATGTGKALQGLQLTKPLNPFLAHSDVAAHKHGLNTWDGSNSHQLDRIHLLST